MAVGDVVEVGRSVRFHVRDAESASSDLLGSLARFRAQADLDAAPAMVPRTPTSSPPAARSSALVA